MTARNISRRHVVAGTLAAATIGTLRRARAQKSDPIRIGCIQTLSGSVGDIGRYHLQGAQAAVKYLNETGGVDGRPVELVVRDSKFSPAEAITALREFSGSGINLIHGESFSSSVMAALPLLKDLNVVNISPSVIAMDATHGQFNRNFFRCGLNARMQYGGQAMVMAKMAPDAKRWGGVVPDTLGSRLGWQMLSFALKQEYKKYANKDVELIDPVFTKTGTVDFRTAISQIVSQKLDGLHAGVAGGEAISFYQQGRPFGLFNEVKILADTNLSVQAGPTLKRATPPNFWSACLWHFDGYKQLPLAQKFYKDLGGEEKNAIIHPYSAQAHTAVMSFAGAIRDAKSTDTDKVISSLENISFDSVFGPLRYRKEDHQLLVNPGYIRLEPQDSEQGYRVADFVTTHWEDLIEPASPGVEFKLE